MTGSTGDFDQRVDRGIGETLRFRNCLIGAVACEGVYAGFQSRVTTDRLQESLVRELQRIRKRCIRKGERGSARYCAWHIRNAVVQNPFDIVGWV